MTTETSRENKGASISIRCYPKVLQEINRRLDKQNLATFRNSCFGHLLGLPEQPFQGQLIFHLLLHMKKGSMDRGMLSFDLNGTSIHFGAQEYFLMTGLPWGNLEDLPTSSSLHRDVFKSKKDITIDDIEKAFEVQCRVKKGRGDVCLQLALLCVVFGVLLSKERKVKSIHNMQLLHLVDDVDRFLRYPWGRVSFQYLLENVEAGYRNMKLLLPKSKRTQFDLNGFVYALQAWAYEVFPHVAKFCAAPMDNKKIGVPRVVRWRGSSSPQFMALTKFFELGPDFKFVPMELSNEEHEAVEAAGLAQSTPEPEAEPQPLMLLPKKSKGKRKIDEGNEDHKNVSRKRCYTQPKHENMGEPSDKESSVTMTEILERLKRNEELLFGLYAHFNLPIPEPKQHESTGSGDGSEHVGAYSKGVEFDEGDLGKHASPDIGEGVDHHSAGPKEDEVPAEVLVQKTVEDEQQCSGDPDKDVVAKTLLDMSSYEHTPADEHTPGGTDDQVLKSPVVFERKRHRNPSQWKHSPWTDPGTKSQKQYNPTHLQKNVVIDEFRAWHSKKRKRDEIDELQLPLSHLDSVDAKWFNLIFRGRGWLSNVHVDVVLNMLMYKANKHPDRFMANWTLMDSFGTVKLMGDNFSKDEPRIMKYATGSWPGERGKPWHEVDYIYGIANIQAMHWVAYVINLKAQTICVYDSLSMDWGALLDDLQHMRRSVPWACRKACVWERKGWAAADLKNEWDLIQFERPPQQGNGNDCGIMSLKFIECFISGHPVDIIVPADALKYRQSFCADLFKLARSKKVV